MYSPGANPVSVNKTPLGPGWQHTYLSFIDRYQTGSTWHIVWHSNGRDAFYTFSTTSGGWDYYTPQTGDHVMSLRRRTTSPNEYQVQLLTGETLVYNSSGQLSEIWDTSTTVNKVLVTWDSTSNGNVSTVTDANGRRRLLFAYSKSFMTSVKFQTKDNGGTWNTQHTTAYDYGNGVTKDATSGWYAPANATEWSSLLEGTGIANPDHVWPMQESSGTLADTIGSTTLTNVGPMSYQTTQSGWSRKGMSCPNINGTFYLYNNTDTALPNLSTTSMTMLSLVAITATPSGDRSFMFNGNANGVRSLVSSSNYPKIKVGTANSATGTSALGIGVRPWILRHNVTNATQKLDTDLERISPTYATPDSTKQVFFGGAVEGAPGMNILYGAEWKGANAELSDAQTTTLINRIENGPGVLTTVTIGGQLAQTNSYSTTGYMTQINDGAGNLIVGFSYASSTNGQVDLVNTSRGTVGFEYNTARSGCTAGDTVLYFNKGNTTSCGVDSDCGAGFLCGGKTGSGSTGTCFSAARCMTNSTIYGETVITNVSPLGAGGGSCTGACTDVAQYVWTSAGAGNVNVNVTGRKDPLGNYTSALYNSNGLATQIVYGDNDGDASNGGGNRITYLSYDTTFPGRLAEVRRPSDLSPSASTCSATVTTGCTRTIYTYTSADFNQLNTVEEAGWTLASDATVTSYRNIITYTHDVRLRVMQINGAVTGINTVFDYTTDRNADPNLDYFLGDSKMYYDATHYLQSFITSYDFWGHPTGLKAPDSNYTCDTYDSSRGHLTSRRKAMNGQTDCSTMSSLDITTSWVRDAGLHLVQLTRPDGSCLLYGYDSTGRLSTVKRRDDCVGANSGDAQQYTYTADSLVSEIDTYGASNTLIAKQPYTYFNSRRIQAVVNPVDTSKFTGLIYDSAGKVTEVDGASSLSKTVFHFDGAPGRDGRVSSEERYKTSSTSDTWSLLYAWLGGQSQVTDGDSKVTGSVRDDIDRLVKLSSPDMSYPTVRVFDSASRITTIVEAAGGGGSQQTHTFTYDYLNRPLSADYQGTCQVGSPPEIQRTYDALPSGISCPTGVTCNNLVGRLAYVKVSLMCDSSSDHSLDQETFYSYDKAGRIVEEYIRDDSSRTADHLYTWTKNGALSQMTTPSGAVIGRTFGSTGDNSDTDLVTSLWRTNTSTPIIDTVKWNPFGPLKQYNWKATVGGTGLMTYILRNLAYRITFVGNGELPDLSTAMNTVTISEDAKGRVVSRVYNPHDPTTTGLFDSYYLYDQQDRVTCETTSSQSTCPTTGSGIKNNQTSLFTNAGDWLKDLRPIPGSTGLTNQFDPSGYGSSHQVTMVRQNDGTPQLGDTAFSYDARGNRTFDDNTSTLTNDRRDYTYDARRNVTNVRGQYYTGGVWHYYDVASAFDASNRRVFKSFYDETSTKTATWFFYYDPSDRLTEVRYTPDTSASSTYSLFQLFWIGDRLTLYWQVDYPSVTTSKRYTSTDETGRIYELVNWPSSGNAGVYWGINESAWGFDNTLNFGAGTIYQPLLFAGQYEDAETIAYENDGATIHRPGLALNGHRTYDPFVGGYLQVDPLADRTRSSYVYVDSNPVGGRDPTGLAMKLNCEWGSTAVSGWYEGFETIYVTAQWNCSVSDDGMGDGGTGGGSTSTSTGGSSTTTPTPPHQMDPHCKTEFQIMLDACEDAFGTPDQPIPIVPPLVLAAISPGAFLQCANFASELAQACDDHPDHVIEPASWDDFKEFIRRLKKISGVQTVGLDFGGVFAIPPYPTPALGGLEGFGPILVGP